MSRTQKNTVLGLTACPPDRGIRALFCPTLDGVPRVKIRYADQRVLAVCYNRMVLREWLDVGLLNVHNITIRSVVSVQFISFITDRQLPLVQSRSG